jgi:hypothetical protein
MYLKNSLIPSSEKDPLNMEYFIFLTFRTAKAGYPKPPISNVDSSSDCLPASAHSHLNGDYFINKSISNETLMEGKIIIKRRIKVSKIITIGKVL